MPTSSWVMVLFEHLGVVAYCPLTRGNVGTSPKYREMSGRDHGDWLGRERPRFWKIVSNFSCLDECDEPGYRQKYRHSSSLEGRPSPTYTEPKTCRESRPTRIAGCGPPGEPLKHGRGHRFNPCRADNRVRFLRLLLPRFECVGKRAVSRAAFLDHDDGPLPVLIEERNVEP
jgi:hypothetical protein